MAKKALVVMAEGYEDTEAVAPIDVLNRVGVDVTIAGLTPSPVKAAYGISMVTDTTLDKIDDLYDVVIFPGGGQNARSLAADDRVITLAKKHHEAGKLVAAICAAPSLVLGEAAGLLRGRRATGDQGLWDKLRSTGAELTEENVTVDGNLITAMGPGAALQFGLCIAARLVGNDEPDKLARKWRLDYPRA